MRSTLAATTTATAGALGGGLGGGLGASTGGALGSGSSLFGASTGGAAATGGGLFGASSGSAFGGTCLRAFVFGDEGHRAFGMRVVVCGAVGRGSLLGISFCVSGGALFVCASVSLMLVTMECVVPPEGEMYMFAQHVRWH